MKKLNLLVLLAGAAFTLPGVGWADTSGTATLTVSGQNQFILDTGATATSGGDFLWTGTAIVPQTGAGAFSFGNLGSTIYDSLIQSVLTSLSYGSGPVSGLSASPGSVVAFKTKGGNYAKLQVTAVDSASLSFKYTTFGASGGGGGASGPSITTIQNNFGLIPPGLPNYGLAPGSLFFIQGSGLAGTTSDLLSSAAPGLQTTVSGVSVAATVGGTTVQCFVYYISPTQIDAVLPSSTPLGTGTVTVTNNGAKSGTFPITVVQSAFGMLSYNGTLAAAYDANNNLLTPTNSANINQTIVLWGSGVGADPGNDDKLYPQKINNLTNIPMQAFIGGVVAPISYRGRSQYPGVDQVVLTVPPGVPVGCYVSIAIVSGSIVSNWSTIPIAASGRSCADPIVIPPGSGTSTTLKVGTLIISQTTSITPQATQTLSTVGGLFLSETLTNFSSTAGSNQASIGNCVVYTSSGAGSTSGSVTTSPLDAGATITVNGPGTPGSVPLSVSSLLGSNFAYYVPAGLTVPNTFIPAAGGAFVFDNGAGGKDVGHFTATLNLPGSFVWTNAAQISAVNRSQGVNVTWTGGASGAYVIISGGSSVIVSGKAVSASFSCEAPVSAGQFTVPVPVLLSLPGGSGSLGLATSIGTQMFTASGLDYGVLSGSMSTAKTVTYN
jgi:uncharacterized protein (TIGR03437 family)